MKGVVLALVLFCCLHVYSQDYIETDSIVDLGLSVNWAKFNVGATKQEEGGYWFAWADARGYTGNKHPFTWQKYKWVESGITLTNGDSYAYYLTKYTIDDGAYGIWYEKKTITTIDNDGFEKTSTEMTFIGDGINNVELEDDGAYHYWHGKWRMPTKSEFQELIDNCTWGYFTYNGVEGCKVTSKINGKWIFLPAINPMEGTELMGSVTYGSYWTSELGGFSFYASYLEFMSEQYSPKMVEIKNYYRYIGRNIRAVQENERSHSGISTEHCDAIHSPKKLILDNNFVVEVDNKKYDLLGRRIK